MNETKVQRLIARSYDHPTIAHTAPWVRETYRYLISQAYGNNRLFGKYITGMGHLVTTTQEIREALRWYGDSEDGPQAYRYSMAQIEEAVCTLWVAGAIKLDYRRTKMQISIND